MRSFLLTTLALPSVFAKAQDAYDYLIVGGGTCGLVLANRLTESPNVTVAVIEAGDSVKDSYNVTQIENYFVNLGTSIDWAYPSVPQEYTDGKVLTFNAGKALGGTSTINGATYVRASRAQIDAWEDLGNEGWNWDSLWPYYLKSEHFQPPTPDLVAKGAEYEASAHGTGGHVGVGWSNYTMGGNAHSVINQTYQNLGIPYNRDQSTGDLHGFSVFPSTIDSKLEIRSDAARSYWYSIESRPNLHLFTNTLAEKIQWSALKPQPKTSKLAASGVQVRPISGGDSRTITARKEVILSAGSHKSPGMLERSGFGNPNILSKMGIPLKYNLPAVGDGLQDQPNVVILANASTNWTGYTPYVTYPTASDLFGANTSNVARHVSDQIPAYAATIASKSNNATTADVVQKQLRIQVDLIFNKSIPVGEILTVPSETQILAAFWLLLPFSRGSTHISSTNTSDAPLISPNFFMLDWDAIGQTAIANLVRRAFHTGPLGEYTGADITPNTTVVPNGAGVEQWLPYFKQSYTPNNHPVSTCAMMSHELGGVVDPELVVYGTQNVRVVDASVLPFQINGHLTSTLYAVAERASDLIKESA
ncbi:GMC oxidoreductase [Zasmidium cellare ATCC 36951]|uniref:GMC oxidoreductase n=1 Tax=Zasmidium cellare ATCC 36951 TaxID=1080233 RepID=A0A6A6CFC4_ZASCE|nr:GMC oxidoreductase [Zasmidium cellare ATCC 36951]KAF2164106.1 GMC oxidoreductase [Zasmidium cellare ATCC 36951]